MKTYVITLSKKFMKGHPKEGNPTNFINRFISHDKIHTIRANYALWKNGLKKFKNVERLFLLEFGKINRIEALKLKLQNYLVLIM